MFWACNLWKLCFTQSPTDKCHRLLTLTFNRLMTLNQITLIHLRHPSDFLMDDQSQWSHNSNFSWKLTKCEETVNRDGASLSAVNSTSILATRGLDNESTVQYAILQLLFVLYWINQLRQRIQTLALNYWVTYGKWCMYWRILGNAFSYMDGICMIIDGRHWESWWKIYSVHTWYMHR